MCNKASTPPDEVPQAGVDALNARRALTPHRDATQQSQDLEYVLPAVTSTPVKAGPNSMLRFSTYSHYRPTTLRMLADEMKGCLVGPMPANKFLTEFLPKSELSGYSKINFTTNAFRRTLAATSELDAYHRFIRDMQPFAPNLRLVDSHATPNGNLRNRSAALQAKPDLSVYADDGSTVCDFSTMEISVEFKWDASSDAFEDTFIEDPSDTPSFLRTSKSAQETLGQITAYASLQLGSQYRTHAFSVLIVQDTARIIRWDREGAIVTKPIKYGEDPALAEFFSRYSQASPELRGVDITVTRASATEAQQAREQLDLEPTVRMFRTVVPRDNDASLLLLFPAPTPLVGHPPAGRATQACAAYEWHSRKKVFLKDSWRIDLDGILSEGETYRRLNSSGVRNVPTCMAFMDVPGIKQQKTQTVRCSRKSWSCPPGAGVLVGHIHHRLVLDTVGTLLTAFKSARELVTAIRDALIAHSDALQKAGILHRDLSPGNIITYMHKGLLIDWDLSKLVGAAGPRQTTRTGTWQFMSATLLRNRLEVHTFQDDLESSLYVLLWTALMNIPSNFEDDSSRSLFIAQNFNELSSGDAKKSFLSHQEILKKQQPLFPKYDALNALLKALADIFRCRYVDPPENDANIAEFLAEINSAKAKELLGKMEINRLRQAAEQLKNHDALLRLYNECIDQSWPHDAPADPQRIVSVDMFGSSISTHIFSKSTHTLETVNTNRKAKRRRTELPASRDEESSGEAVEQERSADATGKLVRTRSPSPLTSLPSESE